MSLGYNSGLTSQCINHWNQLYNSGLTNSGNSLLPLTINIASQTIGFDLVSVKPMSAPKANLIYTDFVYNGVISREIFVCIKSSEKYQLTKNKQYDVGILDNENGIVLKNDINEEITFHVWEEYFLTLLESRRQKLKDIK